MYTLPVTGGSSIVFGVIGAISVAFAFIVRKFQRS